MAKSKSKQKKLPEPESAEELLKKQKIREASLRGTLREAILKGEADRAAAAANEQAEKAQHRDAQRAQRKAEIEHYREWWAQDDRIFVRIRECVAKGEQSFRIQHGSDALATALNSFPGIRAHHRSGFDHINSDDVKEDWQDVTVTWSKQ